MKKLIINADDFGLHKDINEGIITGYKTGIITSTSIMPTGSAFEHAAALAIENPQLGIGVHLTLVGERPVLPAEKIKSLVDNEGRFAAKYPNFLLNYILGKINLEDIYCELRAQVQKVVDSGIKITHLDSHQHMHIVPGISDIVLKIAQEFKVKAMRIPEEPYLFIGGYPYSISRLVARGGLTFLASLARRKTIKRKIQVPDNFFGMLAGGNMQEHYLVNILNCLPDGVSEVMIHPGNNGKVLNTLYNWHYHWQDELAAVTSEEVHRILTHKNIKLISFGELADD